MQIIYDERVTAMESFSMLALYAGYILIMANNEQLKQATTRLLASHPLTAHIVGGPGAACGSEGSGGPDEVFGSSSSGPGLMSSLLYGVKRGTPREQISLVSQNSNGTKTKETNIEDDSLYLAALLVIIQHKRLFRSTLRFQSAARYVIIKMQHRAAQRRQKQTTSATGATSRQTKHQTDEADYFEAQPLSSGSGSEAGGRQRGASERGASAGASQRARMEAYAHGGSMSKNKFSMVTGDEYEFWNMPPGEHESEYHFSLV